MAAAVFCLAATPLRASAAAPFGFTGVNAEDVFAGDDAYQEQMLSLMQQSGVTELRQIWRWAYVEPQPGVLDWSLFDRITLAAARHGIRVLPIVGGEPSWASSRPPGDTSRCLFPPRANADFARWAGLVAQRYGRGGELWQAHPELAQYAFTAYEIWNEPNLARFWACKPDPVAYVALARAASSAIRAVDPRATIIVGGAAKPRTRPGNYVRAMFRAGARSVFDALAVHLYEPTAADVLDIIRKVRRGLAELGARRWSIHVTEFGWATGGPASSHTVSEARHARLLRDTLVALAEQRRRYRIESADYYAWRDLPPPSDFGGGKDYWGLHTGLLRLDGTPKPALSAMLQASRLIR